MSTPSHNITVSGVLFETLGILKAYRSHFLILSILFLQPLFVLLFIYRTISRHVFQTNLNTFLLVVYIVVSFVLSISAIGTITYSTFHGYHNRPLELISTLKSLSSSFIYLGITLLADIFTRLVIPLIGILFGLLKYFDIFSWSKHVFWSVVLFIFMFLACVRYFYVNWILSNVIIVVESKWLEDPFLRSADLMNEMMRKIAMKIKMLFWGVGSLFMLSYYWSLWISDSDNIFSVWVMVAGSCGMTALVEYNLATTVVLYVHCMKMHGKLGVEIEGEECVSLPIDDDGNKSDAVVVVG